LVFSSPVDLHIRNTDFESTASFGPPAKCRTPGAPCESFCRTPTGGGGAVYRMGSILSTIKSRLKQLLRRSNHTSALLTEHRTNTFPFIKSFGPQRRMFSSAPERFIGPPFLSPSRGNAYLSIPMSIPSDCAQTLKTHCSPLRSDRTILASCDKKRFKKFAAGVANFSPRASAPDR